MNTYKGFTIGEKVRFDGKHHPNALGEVVRFDREFKLIYIVANGMLMMVRPDDLRHIGSQMNTPKDKMERILQLVRQTRLKDKGLDK